MKNIVIKEKKNDNKEEVNVKEEKQQQEGQQDVRVVGEENDERMIKVKTEMSECPGSGSHIKQEYNVLKPTAMLLKVLPEKRSSSFIMKLYNLLNVNEFPDIISWIGGGNSFSIHNRSAFISILLPRRFGGVKFNSFLRQLNMYGFKRDFECRRCSHPYFTKANPMLLKLISRRKSSKDQTYCPPIKLMDLVQEDDEVEKKLAPVKKEDVVVSKSESSDYSSCQVVSPFTPQREVQQTSLVTCTRCAHMEQLFSQEDPLQGVFDNEDDKLSVDTLSTTTDILMDEEFSTLLPSAPVSAFEIKDNFENSNDNP